MKTSSQKLSAIVALCALLAPADTHLLAQTRGARPSDAIIGVSNGQAAGIVVGIAAIGAAIGIGAYIAVRHGHSLTGCARSSESGVLNLESESDKQAYTLVGDVSAIKSGDRIRVSGKKSKTSAATRQFLVEKVSRDFGPCDVSPSSR